VRLRVRESGERDREGKKGDGKREKKKIAHVKGLFPE